MHLTSRLGLDVPDGSDNISVYPADSAQSLGVLDNAAMYHQGTISARPVASSYPAGTIYYATDTGLYYVTNGTAWSPLLVGGAWTNVTLGTGLTSAGGYTVSARIVGDMVFLRGQIFMSSTNIVTAGQTVGTLGSAYIPASTAYMTSCYATGSATTTVRLVASHSGSNATISTDANGGAITGTGLAFALDGLFYPLS